MYSSFGKYDADVVVIGGGISGLTAAFTILDVDPSLNVFVLEASDRIGGKILSAQLKSRMGDGQFEVGGQFVMDGQTHLIQLIQKLGINLLERDRRKNDLVAVLEPDKKVECLSSLIEGMSVEDKEDFTKFLGNFEGMMEQLNFLNPTAVTNHGALNRINMETYIRTNLRNDNNRELMLNLIRARKFAGIEARKISLLFYLIYCNSTSGLCKHFFQLNSELKMIEGGVSNVCEELAKRIGPEYIITDDPVVSVERSDTCVVVNTLRVSYRSKVVIVAVPPHQILSIQFEPQLSKRKMEILRNMKFSKVRKFVVTYEFSFWKEAEWSGNLFVSRTAKFRPFIVCYDISTDDTAALTGLISRTTNFDRDHKAEVLKQLAFYFGSKALEPLDYFEKDWSEESFCGGCIAHYPGEAVSMKDFGEIRWPLNRMYWAGAETATYWYGHIAGAVQSGYRAAIEALYDLRPQSLTVQHITNLMPKRELAIIHRELSSGTQLNAVKIIFQFCLIVAIALTVRECVLRLYYIFRFPR